MFRERPQTPSHLKGGLGGNHTGAGGLTKREGRNIERKGDRRARMGRVVKSGQE